jgi:C4-dicarboxylate transporter, DctM subunit
MLPLMLFGSFFLIALAGVPMLFALLAAVTGVVIGTGMDHPLEVIYLSFIGGVEPFILLAVPLFIFAGELLAQGGVGKRIVNLARVLFGWLPGGLGVVTVFSCMMFGGVSGSAIADTAAIGSLIIPSMIERGYSRGFAAVLLSVAGTLALLMPLSIPFLVYAFISGVSMRTLSMAGLLPAFLLAIVLIIVCIWHGKRTGCDDGEARATRAQIWQAIRDAGPALLMPLIIVGGVWTGVFTPSESAAIAVVYGLMISIYYYRDLTWKRIPSLMLKAFITSAVVLLVIGATGAMAWLVTAEQVALSMADWVRSVATEPWSFLLLFNASMLLLGIFIEPLPAMLLSAPLFLPLAKAFGIDLVHFGVIMTANLAIALAHPPVGATLFVSAKLAKASMSDILPNLWAPLGAAIVTVLGITFMPWLTSWLPRLIQSM